MVMAQQQHFQFRYTALIFLMLTLVVVAPALERSYPITHSTHFNLSWAFQYQRQFFAGQFYPRWLEFSNFGFGNATFAFYPPLPFTATLPFRALGAGIAGSLIGSMGLAAAVLGAGLYRYAYRFYPQWIAALAAMLGMFSPYFLVDIYQRGSVGEVWAIALIPWILLASHVTIGRAEYWASHADDSPQPRLAAWGLTADWDLLGLVLAYSLLVLSHLPTLLMFTLVWLLLPWITATPGQRQAAARRCYLAAALAWTTTAFFLLPVLVDGRSAQLEALGFSPEYQPQNRLMLSGLWQFSPQLTDHWFDLTLLPFWAVLAAIVAAAAVGYAIVGSGWIRPSTHQRLAVYWMLVSAIALLMTTDVLGWLYPLFPPLQKIQFSWRWLAVVTPLMPLLVADWLWRSDRANPSETEKQLLSTLLAGGLWFVIAWQAWQGLRVAETATYEPATIDRFAQLAAVKTFPETPHRLPKESFLNWHWIYADGLALSDVYEYRAQGVTLEMPPPQDYPLVAWQDGTTAQLTRDRWQFGKRQFSANNDRSTSQAAVLRTLYYPAWFARIDDAPWQRADRTEDGRLRIWIPPGSHTVMVAYRGTFAERLGIWLSALSGVGLVKIGWNRFRQRHSTGPT